MLVIDPNLSRRLLQVQKKKEDKHEAESFSQIDDGSMNTSVRNDLLARKIRVLQSVSIFRNVN